MVLFVYKYCVILIEDLGSGILFDFLEYGIDDEFIVK